MAIVFAPTIAMMLAGIDPLGETEKKLARVEHLRMQMEDVGETRVVSARRVSIGFDTDRDTHRVFVIREVSTEIKFTPRDGETEHDAFLRVCKERGITGVIRHSEPRKI